jgi:hypothetical protein
MSETNEQAAARGIAVEKWLTDSHLGRTPIISFHDGFDAGWNAALEHRAQEQERVKVEELRLELPLKQDSYNGMMIWTADDQRFCDMRGWGYLRGVGGLSLSDEEAMKIQDARGKLVVDAVNKFVQEQGGICEQAHPAPPSDEAEG